MPSIFPQVVAIAASVMGIGGADAQSLRCNGDLASIGNTKAAVYRICGAPVTMDTYCKPQMLVIRPPQYPGGPTTVITPPCEPVEEWTYNPGSGQFWTTFRFENGQAVAIVYGDRIP